MSVIAVFAGARTHPGLNESKNLQVESNSLIQHSVFKQTGIARIIECLVIANAFPTVFASLENLLPAAICYNKCHIDYRFDCRNRAIPSQTVGKVINFHLIVKPHKNTEYCRSNFIVPDCFKYKLRQLAVVEKIDHFTVTVFYHFKLFCHNHSSPTMTSASIL